MTAALAAGSPPAAGRFALPPASEATGPPEQRGLARDEVRLLRAEAVPAAAIGGAAVPAGAVLRHHRFRDLPELLTPGDLLVVNTSATLPAALSAELPGGRPSLVHVAGALADGAWVVEVRRRDGAGPDTEVRTGTVLVLPAGTGLRLVEPYPHARAGEWSRLWRARAEPAVPLVDYLHEHGRPIAYGYLSGPRPLADYQTVYAGEPGSAEMPSAGRPFTAEVLVRLMARGIAVAPVVLHAGVSSPELHEPPAPERFEVPAATARLVRSAHRAGHRVVAVGTTVVRALEAATGPDGGTRAAAGWTDLVLGPDRPARVVTGLISGLHEPEASHLLLLDAVAGPDLVTAAYREAVTERYLWHEFGDSMLLLP